MDEFLLRFVCEGEKRDIFVPKDADAEDIARAALDFAGNGPIAEAYLFVAIIQPHVSWDDRKRMGKAVQLIREGLV